MSRENSTQHKRVLTNKDSPDGFPTTESKRTHFSGTASCFCDMMKETGSRTRVRRRGAIYALYNYFSRKESQF